MSGILEISELKKNYGSVQALKGVSLQIPKRSIYGLLGPNGSGKTTLLGILLDVLQANQGHYRWCEYKDAQEARRHIGSLLETPNFYPYLTAWDNLALSAQVKQRGATDIERVLTLVNLQSRKDSRFSTFSLGMKQRLAIAAALLGQPDILVLDEPTNGLDPSGIAEIRELILSLNREGVTVIIASHLLDEIEKVCTHVAILKLGTLIAEGAVSEVLSDENWIEIDATNRSGLLQELRKHPGIKSLREEQKIWMVLETGYELEDLCRTLYAANIIPNHLLRKKRSLESKFMEITQ